MREDTPEWDAAMSSRDGLVIDFTRTPKIAGSPAPPKVIGVEIDRQLSGDVPDGVRLVGGSATATGKITIDALADGAPNPLDADDLADWIGSATQVTVGFSDHVLPIHTGAVRSLSGSDAARSVSVELLDGSDALRSTVTLPAFGSIAKRWMPGRRWRYPINASAIVVAALHACGIRMTPPPRPEVVASIPMVFGAVPDVGWLVPNGPGIDDGEPAAGDDGQWGPVVNAEATIMPLTVYPDRHLRFGVDCTYLAADCWVLVGPSWYTAVQIDFQDISVQIQPGPSAINLQAKADGEYWTVRATKTCAAGWHHVRLTGQLGTGVTLQVDSAANSASYSYAIGAFTTVTETKVTIITPCYVQAFQLLASTAAISADWAGDAAFTPEADVSTSALDLDYLPAVNQVVAWTLIKQLAAAEFGMAGFDESGRFAYRTRAEVNSSTDPVLDLSGEVLDDVRGTASVDSVRSRLETQVRYRALIESGAGHETEAGTAVPVAKADAVWSLPPGWSSHAISASNPWHPVESEIYAIYSPGQAWDIPNGIVICDDEVGTSRVEAGFCGYVVPTGPTSAVMWIHNAAASTRFAVWPKDWTQATYGDLPFGFAPEGPAAWVNGRGLTADDPAGPLAIDFAGAIAEWGVRTLSLESSEFRQNYSSVYSLGLGMLHDLAKPRLALSDITIPGDPRLELGDVVRILGQARFADILARITRIQTRAGISLPDQGLTTTLGLRVIDPANFYAPTVTSVYPDAGPTAGGTVVTIDGDHLTEVTAVTFGGQLATAVTVVDDSQLTCVTPAASEGAVDVAVGSSGGVATVVDAYRVGGTPTPHIPPTVTVQPENEDDIWVSNGETVTFTSAASGTAPLSVQWQRRWSLDGYTDWSAWGDVAGATSATLNQVVSPANGYFTHGTADEWWQFRAVWTNAYGSATSEASERVVTPNPYAAPTVTTQPRSTTAISWQYDTFTFTSAASGLPSPTVQWQRRWSLTGTSGWSSWSDISGATSATLTQTASPENGYFTHSGAADGATEYWQFRAVWTNTYGTATSDTSGYQRVIWSVE